MNLQNYLREKWSMQPGNALGECKIDAEADTPAFFFDSDAFSARIHKIKELLGEEIPLTYSIKANPFLLNCLPKEIEHVEVCSPGELEICQKMGIAPEHIIYSGVMKELTDVRRASLYGVAIMTAESMLHVKLENEVSTAARPQKVILRLTSGNQFGMSEEDIEYLVSHKEEYPNLEFYGIHYYSGTQKKKLKNIEKDLFHLTEFLSKLEENYGFEAQLVEFGPGLAVNYFNEPYEDADMALLAEAAEVLKGFAASFPLGIEMGRFMAATCGTYVTQVKDIKNSCDTNYLIVDGGMHHLKYYGQTMAMQVPPIWTLNGSSHSPEKESGILAKDYCICGSLCTVADVLVREARLPELQVGDFLGFERCGAYSVTEGSALFLSRTMPRVYLYSEEKGAKLLRDFVPTDKINMADPLNACLAEVTSWN